MTTRKRSAGSQRPPAKTPEGREKQLIAAAYDLAEEQIISKVASAQVITHFLKLGTEREKLERMKLAGENKLLEAKVESIASTAKSAELYEKALAAFTSYKGRGAAGESED